MVGEVYDEFMGVRSNVSLIFEIKPPAIKIAAVLLRGLSKWIFSSDNSE